MPILVSFIYLVFISDSWGRETNHLTWYKWRLQKFEKHRCAIYTPPWFCVKLNSHDITTLAENTAIGNVTLCLKCDDTRAETRYRLSAKRTSPFKSAGERQFSQLLAAELCASAVVMLDTPCSEVVWSVLATHSIRQFPLHFPSRSSPCAITFQLDCIHKLPPFTRHCLETVRWLLISLFNDSVSFANYH